MTVNSKKDSHVSFSTFETREYQRVIVSDKNGGIGLGLGWEYKDRAPAQIDDLIEFSKSKNACKTSLDERCNILLSFGFTTYDLKDAVRNQKSQLARARGIQTHRSMIILYREPIRSIAHHSVRSKASIYIPRHQIK